MFHLAYREHIQRLSFLPGALCLSLLLPPSTLSAAEAPASGTLPVDLVDALVQDLWSLSPRLVPAEPTIEYLEPTLAMVSVMASETEHAPVQRVRAVLRQHLFAWDGATWKSVGMVGSDFNADPVRMKNRLELRIPGLAPSTEDLVISDTVNLELSEAFGSAWQAVASAGDPDAARAVLARMVGPDAIVAMDRVTEINIGNDGRLVDGHQTLDAILRQLREDGGLPAMSTKREPVTTGGPMTLAWFDWDCWVDCFSSISLQVSFTQALCLGIGLTACLAAGPAAPGCAAVVFAGCGVVALASEIAAAIACLFKLC